MFDTAFPPYPDEPEPPPELYHQLRPTLELCSLWGLLKRLRILRPEQTLKDHLRLFKIIVRAERTIRPERVAKTEAEIAKEEEEFQRLDQELDEEFGPDVVYSPDSHVLHLKSVSLIMSLSPDDLDDPEGNDRKRLADNGGNVVEFVDAYLRSQTARTSVFLNWSALEEAAEDFDRQIEEDLAKS